MLDEARRAPSASSAIVRELRSFSRADGETRQRVDLAAVVQSAIKMVGQRDPAPRPRHHVVRARRARCSANEARLEQVVVNLLLNAAQAMPEERAADERDPRPRSARTASDARCSRSSTTATGSRPTCCRASSTPSSRPSRVGRRHGARPVDLPRHRDVARRAHRRVQRAGRGHHVPRRAADDRDARDRLEPPPASEPPSSREPRAGARPGRGRRDPHREHAARAARARARRGRRPRARARRSPRSRGRRLRRRLLRPDDARHERDRPLRAHPRASARARASASSS